MRVSVRSYKIKTIKGGVYIRNRKFIRIKYTDSRQSLQTTDSNRVPSHSTHTEEDPSELQKGCKD